MFERSVGGRTNGENPDDQAVNHTGLSSGCQHDVYLTPSGVARGMREHATQSGPFFLSEEEVGTHGRKTWFDRLLEVDPRAASFVIAEDYQKRPVQKIAVLPFVNEGNGDYFINKIPLKILDNTERNKWSWPHANRVRRAVAGELASREFIIVPRLRVDAVLATHGTTDKENLNAVPPDELGRWLDADTVVYGELLNYEAYYAFLVAAWKVSARVRMVSTKDGYEIFSCTNNRYETTVHPVIDPIDMVINAIASLFHLRDITLVRTEYEVGREIVMRLPRAERNIFEFLAAIKDATPALGSSEIQASTSNDSLK
ncbi:MAG: DUF799 family lipoprotein [Nitrospirales bacterium]|nr:DUF799 family lipoprotein [Nitrospirales bacterium]